MARTRQHQPSRPCANLQAAHLLSVELVAGKYRCPCRGRRSSDVRALEKTLLRSFPTSIKKPATLWSPLNLQNFLRPPGRVVKLPNGIPRLQSAFAAPIGRPKLRKLQRVLADRLLQIRSRYPTICSWPHLLLPLPSPARLLSKPRLCLKRLSLLPLSFRAATSPKRRDAVCAAVAAAAAV